MRKLTRAVPIAAIILALGCERPLEFPAPPTPPVDAEPPRQAPVPVDEGPKPSRALLALAVAWARADKLGPDPNGLARDRLVASIVAAHGRLGQYEEAARISRHSKDSLFLPKTWALIAASGDTTEAVIALGDATPAGTAYARAYMLTAIADAQERRGRSHAALQAGRAALAMLERVEHVGARAHLTSGVARSCARVGCGAQALAALPAISKAAGALTPPWQRAEAQAGVALAYARLGRAEEARAAIRRAGLSAFAAKPALRGNLTAQIVPALAALGAVEEAYSVAGRIPPDIRYLGLEKIGAELIESGDIAGAIAALPPLRDEWLTLETLSKLSISRGHFEVAVRAAEVATNESVSEDIREWLALGRARVGDAAGALAAAAGTSARTQAAQVLAESGEPEAAIRLLGQALADVAAIRHLDRRQARRAEIAVGLMAVGRRDEALTMAREVWATMVDDTVPSMDFVIGAHVRDRPWLAPGAGAHLEKIARSAASRRRGGALAQVAEVYAAAGLPANALGILQHLKTPRSRVLTLIAVARHVDVAPLAHRTEAARLARVLTESQR